MEDSDGTDQGDQVRGVDCSPAGLSQDSTQTAQSSGWPQPQRSKTTSPQEFSQRPPKQDDHHHASSQDCPSRSTATSTERAQQYPKSQTAGVYAGLTNYRRIIELGGGCTPADVAVIGDEDAVYNQLRRLLDAGATDIWAHPVAVGDQRTERSTSRQRTVTFLSALATRN
jgi:hypothetical protein